MNNLNETMFGQLIVILLKFRKWKTLIMQEKKIFGGFCYANEKVVICFTYVFCIRNIEISKKC